MSVFIWFWIVSGVFGYAITFATLQRQFKLITRENLWDAFRFSLLIGLFGPIGLLAIVAVVILEGSRFQGLNSLPNHLVSKLSTSDPFILINANPVATTTDIDGEDSSDG